MKYSIISVILISTMIFISSFQTFAQDPPPPPGGGHGQGGGQVPGGGAPTGEGILLLIALATGYGLKKYLSGKQKVIANSY